MPHGPDVFSGNLFEEEPKRGLVESSSPGRDAEIINKGRKEEDIYRKAAESVGALRKSQGKIFDEHDPLIAVHARFIRSELQQKEQEAAREARRKTIPFKDAKNRAANDRELEN